MDDLFTDLSTEELLKLQSLFPKHSEESFSLASLDGFFSGLYCLPGMHMPSEWLQDVIPEMPDNSKKAVEQALNLILRYYNQVGYFMNEQEASPNFDGSFSGAKEWLEGFSMAFGYETDALGKLADAEAKESGNEDQLFIAPVILTFGMDVENAPADEDRDNFLKLKEVILTMLEKGSHEDRLGLLTDIANSSYELLETAREKRLKAMKPNSSLIAEPKLGRNDPCYCGSGKKYKHCHGKK
ncbi:MAG: UPF0149 family protein [Trueperaceae bacterium]|nr:UPF0149 family protein [Trueperaceae bacterium]